jgi:hypothetical protein
LSFSRFSFLRHVEVEFEYIVRAFPDHTFYEFVSVISSPRLETCLILNYNSDIDKLRQILQATPKPNSESTIQKEGEQPKPNVNVKITLSLEIMEEGAEVHHSSVRAALDCAIGNGTFDFLNSAPDLEVHIHQWNYAQQ